MQMKMLQIAVSQTEMLQIAVSQKEKAFRINGVAFAKRHLVNTLGKECKGDLDKMLARYLVIVPFLAEALELKGDENASVKYGAFKAKRIYKALGLSDESVAPFMLAMLQMAGDMPTVEALRNMGPMVARTFQGKPKDTDGLEWCDDCQAYHPKERDDNVIPFPVKPTLH